MQPESYRLTALPGKPNRVLPIGVIADGKHAGQPLGVHVHTGSTRIVAAADVPALEAHLQSEGIASDYQLVPLQRTARGSDHRRGQFARKGQGRGAPRSPAPAQARSAPVPSSSSGSEFGEPDDLER